MQTSTPATIKYTVGVPGSGKSYTRVRWMIEHFLPNEEGVLFTNLPLNIDFIVAHMEKNGFDGEAIRNRIHVISSDELRLWKKTDPSTRMPAVNPNYDEELANKQSEESGDIDYTETQYPYVGPWLYFQHRDVSGGHILLDEIQEIVHVKSSQRLRDEWSNWLGTIRHENCTIEFMTQLDARVPKEVKGTAETKLEIVPCQSDRCPLLPILNYDWYQIWNKFLGVNMTASIVVESNIKLGGKRAHGKPEKYRFDPYYFQMYDSFNRTSSKKKSSRKKQEWERMGRLALLWWFTKRNAKYFVLTTVCCIGLIFMMKGGMNHLLGWLQGDPKQERMQALAKKQGLTLEQYKKKKDEERLKKELIAEMKRELQAAAPQAPVVVSAPVVPRPPQVKTVVKKEEKKADKLKLTFISADAEYAILSNGRRLRPGDDFEGKKVARISFAERLMELEDGEKVYQ